MKLEKQTTILTYGLLSVAGIVAYSLPARLPSAYARPAPAEDVMRLSGVIRDFSEEHSDFNKVPNGGYGHYAGNLSQALGDDGNPVFIGDMKGEPLTEFTLTNGVLVPQKKFAAMVSVIGAAITASGTPVPVTMKAQFGSTVIEPFGAFATPAAGNVNTSGNPRSYIVQQIFDAGTSITVTGRSWNPATTAFITANTSSNSPQVKVLRDGDPVPAIQGFDNQEDVEAYLNDYIDYDLGVITLEKNQAIYLYELGTTNLTSTAADFQDLVVLVTLANDPGWFRLTDSTGVPLSSKKAKLGYKVDQEWRDSSGRAIPPHLATASDVAGVAGIASTGGITSTETFGDWYNDSLGVNLSAPHSIKLKRNADGVFEYNTNAFHPIDGRLGGNEGDSHNNHFSLAIESSFTYDADADQFFEFSGSDDAWLYVNGKLVMDLGGIKPGTGQYVDMGRLGLADGETYTINFFYAQRQSETADFSMRTNVWMPNSDEASASVSAGWD